MVLAAAKAFSASSVAITDIRPDNLPVAKQLGAKHTLDQSQATSASDTVEALKAVFAEGPDIVIDCVGFESTITVSILTRMPLSLPFCAHNEKPCPHVSSQSLHLSFIRESSHPTMRMSAYLALHISPTTACHLTQGGHTIFAGGSALTSACLLRED